MARQRMPSKATFLLMIVVLMNGCGQASFTATEQPEQSNKTTALQNPKQRPPQPKASDQQATTTSDSRAKTLEDSFLVEPGKVGILENFMNVDEALSIAGPGRTKLVDLMNEGNFSPALEIRLSKEEKDPALVASVWWVCNRFSIYGISVRDPRYRTKEGLGVGSTLGELQQYFKVGPPLEESEDGTLAAITPGLTFSLEHADHPTDKTKVKSVWVYPEEEKMHGRWCP